MSQTDRPPVCDLHRIIEENQREMKSDIKDVSDDVENLKVEVTSLKEKVSAVHRKNNQIEMDVLEVQKKVTDMGYEVGLAQQATKNVTKNLETIANDTKNTNDLFHSLDKKVVVLSVKVGVILAGLMAVSANLDKILTLFLGAR